MLIVVHILACNHTSAQCSIDFNNNSTEFEATKSHTHLHLLQKSIQNVSQSVQALTNVRQLDNKKLSYRRETARQLPT